ncbi:MAG: class I SAM-dependent methyltransferase [Bacteroidetes bacterium]|nr:class I SAM-dependent methyltransferase [Bacteroidota bacterium]
MKSLNGFDTISHVYDPLAKLAFGRSIQQSQLFFLNKIRKQSKILILGGGTGWILLELLKRQPECEVWYIEASAKMISSSRIKTTNDQRVHFIHGTEENIPNQHFDVAITNFFLDLFDDKSIYHLIGKIKTKLKPGSIWIATDFVNRKRWHAPVLKLMYLFFRVTCGINSTYLPKWSEAMKTEMKEIESKSFCSEFMETKLFLLR